MFFQLLPRVSSSSGVPFQAVHVAKNIVQLESVYNELKDAMMALAKAAARAWIGYRQPAGNLHISAVELHVKAG